MENLYDIFLDFPATFDYQIKRGTQRLFSGPSWDVIFPLLVLHQFLW